MEVQVNRHLLVPYTENGVGELDVPAGQFAVEFPVIQPPLCTQYWGSLDISTVGSTGLHAWCWVFGFHTGM